MTDEMARSARRVKVGATLDPELVAAVDRYVDEHPGSDRSGVIDEALRLWYARRQDEAMERQFSAPRSRREIEEREAWKPIQAAAAERVFRKR
jgi:Arc/MetJ-type ribon-helix-helix transcriptional regulator